LRREAHFEIKCGKSFGALLEVDMMKKCTALWHEAHFEANMLKHLSSGALLEVEILKKCTLLWREAHIEIKMCKWFWISNWIDGFWRTLATNLPPTLHSQMIFYSHSWTSFNFFWSQRAIPQTGVCANINQCV
jgi:hypothetical protein